MKKLEYILIAAIATFIVLSLGIATLNALPDESKVSEFVYIHNTDTFSYRTAIEFYEDVITETDFLLVCDSTVFNDFPVRSYEWIEALFDYYFEWEETYYKQ